MHEVVAYADDNNLTLLLVAQRYGVTTGLNDEQLVNFYKQFGFFVRDEVLPVVMERPIRGVLQTL